ncbi:MAG: phosphodiester glycosidase family protein, partial [Legionellales bacterium]|nr:phosphodiester glycosidase family protein [Legionellales bacterium]
DQYEVDFVKARNSYIGRETIPAIAERTNSDIAINSGFFEIGNGLDGVPSKNLIINNTIYSLKTTKQAVVAKDISGKLEIKIINPEIVLINGNSKITISHINQYPSSNELVLFTSGYGERTLTNFNNRKEIAFDGQGNFIYTYEHGNSLIPRDGYILSLPQSFILAEQESLSLEINTGLKNNISAVTGIPMLIYNNEIIKDLYNKKSSFYKNQHARTAIGYKEDGSIIIVVVEHAYKKDLKHITWEEVSLILQTKNKDISNKYKTTANNLTLRQLRGILEQELTDSNNLQGLSIIELAKIMQNLGCKYAINLDGGGSSTLWIQGEVMNKVYGDIDEGNGVRRLRPISDAIIFKKKCNCA